MTDDIVVYDPATVGRTKGDELYKQGSLAFFPSSKSMVRPRDPETSSNESDGCTPGDDEEYGCSPAGRQTKRKRA